MSETATLSMMSSTLLHLLVPMVTDLAIEVLRGLTWQVPGN